MHVLMPVFNILNAFLYIPSIYITVFEKFEISTQGFMWELLFGGEKTVERDVTEGPL